MIRAIALVALGVGCGPAVAAQSPVEPPDAFADDGVRELLTRARNARYRDLQGIRSYEGTMRQRIYVGLTALRFRRERGLFEMERIARIRWSDDGHRAIQWLGARTAIPIVGIDTGRPGGVATLAVTDSSVSISASTELEQDMAEEMLEETDIPGFDLDPGADQLTFGDDDWALHPLADSAVAHYRFASGDTLRISLPPPNRNVVLYEVRVEPRRADFHLVAGSLWFDSETASLVRATYKPARPFDMLLDEPEEAADVPAFFQPIQAEISYITVEYSFHEFRYWLPRRFAFEGEASMGNFVQIPITLEWNIGDYLINEESEIPLTGDLPDGWRRQDNPDEDSQGNETVVTVIVPTAEELREFPGLSDDFGQRSPTAFSDVEIDELRAELEGLLPTYSRFRPRIAWGLRRDLIRYNRVEGLSVGAEATVPLTPTAEIGARARIGTGDHEPGGTLELRLGTAERRWTLAGYHRLESMADWSSPFWPTTLVGNFLFGTDRGQYYRATGLSLARQQRGDRLRTRVEVFHELQRAVSLTSDFFVFQSIVDDTLDTVLPAADLDVSGARASLRWFAGTDPNGLILTGQLLGEIGIRGNDYRRAAAIASASHPLFLGLAGAVELGAGATWGDEPQQRRFFLGGAQTLRGFETNRVSGASFWRARGELATGFAGARIGLFGDAAWAGPRRAFVLDDPSVSVGVGTSLLDGLVRLDLARAIRRGTGWKLHAYFDGLF